MLLRSDEECSAIQNLNFLRSHRNIDEKSYERRQDKVKLGEKAEFIFINEQFEPNFNAVLTSAIRNPSMLTRVGAVQEQGISA